MATARGRVTCRRPLTMREPRRHAPDRPGASRRRSRFAICRGEFVGLIGESGSGKTTLGTALLRLLEKPGRISGGVDPLRRHDLTDAEPGRAAGYRWRDISTVFQSSMNSLNPVVRDRGQFRT